MPSVIIGYWNELLPAHCGHHRKQYSQFKCDVTLRRVRVTLGAEVEIILYCGDFECPFGSKRSIAWRFYIPAKYINVHVLWNVDTDENVGRTSRERCVHEVFSMR